MKQKQYTPCPKCRTIGIVGEKCAFCGSEIKVWDENRVYTQKKLNPKKDADEDDVYERFRYFDPDGTPTEKNISGLGHRWIKVTVNGMSGVFNSWMECMVPPKYEDITAKENFFGIKEKGSDKWHVVDNINRNIVTQKNNKKITLSDGNFEENGKQLVFYDNDYVRVYDVDSKTDIIKPSAKYTAIFPVSNGYAVGVERHSTHEDPKLFEMHTKLITQEYPCSGFVDMKGKVILNPYENMEWLNFRPWVVGNNCSMGVWHPSMDSRLFSFDMNRDPEEQILNIVKNARMRILFRQYRWIIWVVLLILLLIWIF